MYMFLTGGTDGATFAPEVHQLPPNELEGREGFVDFDEAVKYIRKYLFGHLVDSIGDYNNPGAKTDACIEVLCAQSSFLSHEAAWCTSEPATQGTVSFWVCVGLVRSA